MSATNEATEQWSLEHETTERDNFTDSIYEDEYKGLLIARCNQNGNYNAHSHKLKASPVMFAVLEVIVEALKDPAGGSYWPAVELACEFGIYTDNLEGQRVLFELAKYAISKATGQE